MSDPPEPDRSATFTRSGSTSRSLLAGLKSGRADAWDRLVLLYTPLVEFWCRRLDLAEQDIGDVVQDVFQAVAVHIADFRRRRPGDSFRGWLRTITRNKVYDSFRRQGRQPRATGGTEASLRLAQLPAGTPDTADDESVVEEQQAIGGLMVRALDAIRGEFHDRTWQAFWHVVVDGRTPADVGDELHMRPGTVRVAKSRVLCRLRQELGEVVDSPDQP